MRSRESLLQQGAAVSGASVALSALNSRLDDLATQLEVCEPFNDEILYLNSAAVSFWFILSFIFRRVLWILLCPLLHQRQKLLQLELRKHVDH